MNKRLVIENWYRFMKEDTGEDPIDKLLKDMEENDPEAFAAMQSELATYDVDPHEVSPEQLYKVFDKYAAEKETSMLTSRGSNPFDFDQEAFNKRFDVTGDNKFDLNDVLELGNKSVPYGIFFGAHVTGGTQDKEVTTKSARVNAVNVPGIFKSLSDANPAQSTAPYLVVYMIQANGAERYFIFDPMEAFSMNRKKIDPSDPIFSDRNSMKGYYSKMEKEDDIVGEALKLCYNFIPSAEFFSHYSITIDEEIAELTAMTVKSSINIEVVDTGENSLLGKMLRDSQSWEGSTQEYIFATDIKVSIGGSFGFDERMDQLLFVLDHLPMLTNVNFVLRGVMTGGQQKKLLALLEKHEPHYSYKFESSFFEENSLMEDYEIIKRIKKVRNG